MTITEHDIQHIESYWTEYDEHQVADLAAATLARLHDLEPEVYYLRRQLWALIEWAAEHRPGLSTGILEGVANLALGQIESRYLAAQVQCIVATLPPPDLVHH
ncbi:hypothetical protein Mycsm_02680 [Mycobacterium sp. JS623]|uniref:hypothetical protein n=1 Tax=Mycobacterium sp. JS623 TaxID=212767 RepID=UPI0002A551EC|nr:hypothetical protein [Mycobacterium sp. JS623]AGB23013.1 hypothetical protein Mycsm_02680 [Mycobacterium sp. JS623]